MIINLVPVELIFQKVITDLNITEHDVDVKAFNQWAMEAIEHIGGLHRVEALQQLLQHGVTVKQQLNDHQALFPYGILGISDVRYYKDDKVKRADFDVALPANGRDMEDGDAQVYFDRIYLVEKAKGSTFGLALNRKDGLIEALGCRLPVMRNNTGDDIGIFVPDLASFREAVYWYICSKLLWRDVYRGRNKGNQHAYANGMFNNMKNVAYGELMMPDRWEVQDLADELSLNVSYTGLNRRRLSFGRDNDIPTKIYWGYKKDEIRNL